MQIGNYYNLPTYYYLPTTTTIYLPTYLSTTTTYLPTATTYPPTTTSTS